MRWFHFNTTSYVQISCRITLHVKFGLNLKTRLSRQQDDTSGNDNATVLFLPILNSKHTKLFWSSSGIANLIIRPDKTKHTHHNKKNKICKRNKRIGRRQRLSQECTQTHLEFQHQDVKACTFLVSCMLVRLRMTAANIE